jgi:hypothetical protein
MTGAAPALGLLAGLVAVGSMVPYVRDTLRRSTSPHRGTWLIWGVLGVVVCESQRAEGASWSLVLSEAQIAVNLLVIALAIRLGTGGLSAVDAALMALAGAGVAGWFVAGEPMVAIGCVIAADLVAAAMMLPKTWRDPRSETLSTFALGSLAGALALGSLAGLQPSLFAYPLYYCLVNGALALVIQRRRATAGRAGRISHPSPLVAGARAASGP